MHILYITPWIPYPLSSGGSQAFFNYVDAIRHDCNVSVLLTAHNEKEEADIEELKKIWNNVDIKVYDFRKEDKYKGLTSRKRLEVKLFDKTRRSCERKIRRRVETAKGNTPMYLDAHSKVWLRNEYAVLHCKYEDLTPGYLNYVQEVASQGFDIIQVEFYESLPLVYILPDNAKKIFVHHEIRFVHNEDEMRLFKHKTATDKIEYATQKAKEIDALSRYDQIVVLSEYDKNVIKEYLPDSDVYVSPAMTKSMADKTELSFTPCHDIVFVGNSNHLPNVEGLMWFVTEVMPKLLSNGYDGTLWITGIWNREIQAAISSQCNNVRFAGFVDDLSLFLNGKITIVPIRIGGGIRMKILESIASKSPIVSTIKGCEGLPLYNNENSFVTDDVSEFADAIKRLADDAELQKSLTNKASESIKLNMNPEKLLNIRKGIYTDGHNSNPRI